MVYISTNISLFAMYTMMGGGGIHLEMPKKIVFLQQQEKEAELKNKL